MKESGSVPIQAKLARSYCRTLSQEAGYIQKVLNFFPGDVYHDIRTCSNHSGRSRKMEAGI
jgi:hypothetical protein